MSDRDIGHDSEVAEGDRLEVDPSPEYNADAGFDTEVVPDGVYEELSTAGGDEQIDELTYEDEGDGAPEAFITPEDPDFRDLDEEDE